MKSIFTFLFSALLFAGCSVEGPRQSSSPNQQFKGEWIVSSVDNEILSLYRIPGDEPVVGSRVSICFSLPGGDEKIPRAEGAITAFDDQIISVTVDPTTRTGSTQPGDQVLPVFPL